MVRRGKGLARYDEGLRASLAHHRAGWAHQCQATSRGRSASSPAASPTPRSSARLRAPAVPARRRRSRRRRRRRGRRRRRPEEEEQAGGGGSGGGGRWGLRHHLPPGAGGPPAPGTAGGAA
eukprot:15440092-Alexandrium_andersonii.AAC.1